MSNKQPLSYNDLTVWGCFSANGVGDIVIFTENLDAQLMKNILNQHLIKSARLLIPTGSWWLLQDGDPKHRSVLVQTWLFNHGVQLIDFPPYSPDVNPIENLWNESETESRGKKCNNYRGVETTLT